METTILDAIEQLLVFGVSNDLIEPFDMIYTRNALFDLLAVKITQPMQFDTRDKSLAHKGQTPTALLDQLTDYAFEHKIIPENTVTVRDLFAARVMGCFMPRPSAIVNKFQSQFKESPEAATDAFYEFCKACHYIQVDRIKRNMHWTTASDYGEIEVTINLSKPEKDPKEIALAANEAKSGYPLCLLCKENQGFAGTLNHPARQNLALIPVRLNGEVWYFQYSPHVYYNEHCIVLSQHHVPMKISEKTFRRLLDFVTQFPHYFLGSNADLPIVGGSILSHDHFQGGKHTFAMQKAGAYATYTASTSPTVSIQLVKWPLSVVRLVGDSTDCLAGLAHYILEQWREYTDPACEVLAYTEGTPHNTITPIASRNKNGAYVLDLVLRNNRTTPEHPDGLFHPHKELHHVKKENIGLIEVMGIGVLPGRLKEEITHGGMTKEEIGTVFVKVLEDCGVFPFTEEGRAGFHRFMTHCRFVQKM